MEEKIFATIANDADTRDRYLDTFRRSEYLEPEKALLPRAACIRAIWKK